MKSIVERQKENGGGGGEMVFNGTTVFLVNQMRCYEINETLKFTCFRSQQQLSRTRQQFMKYMKTIPTARDTKDAIKIFVRFLKEAAV